MSEDTVYFKRVSFPIPISKGELETMLHSLSPKYEMHGKNHGSLDTSQMIVFFSCLPNGTAGRFNGLEFRAQYGVDDYSRLRQAIIQFEALRGKVLSYFTDL